MRDLRASLESFRIASGDPVWSSTTLARLFEQSRGKEAELATALSELLGEVPQLTESLAHFVDDFVRAYAIQRARLLALPAATPAQAYLAIWMIPEEASTPEVLVSILRALENTPQFEAAVVELAASLSDNAVRDRLLAGARTEDAKLWVRVQRALRKVG
jgi:hypothetical protein